MPGRPPWLFQGTVPSLNGFRAVAILLVILCHLSLKPGSLFAVLPLAGDIGVQLFFVISGFLITLLLERERRRTGTVSLKRFYIRRCLRILPAYVFFLLAMALLQQLGAVHVPPGAWVNAATYTTSLVSLDDGGDLGHTWSLSVEEHFYLLWPFLFLILGRRRGFFACAAYVALTPLLRVAYYTYVARHGGVSVSFFTFCQMDCIAVGCCLALLATSATARRYLWPSAGCLAVLLLGAAALLLLSKALTTAFAQDRAVALYQTFLSPTANALLLAVIVWCGINASGSWLSGLLNSRPLVLVGVLSYSIYLWQQPLTDWTRDGGVLSFPFNVCLVALAACFSYVVIESPFLRLKERLGAPRRPGGPLATGELQGAKPTSRAEAGCESS